MKKNQNIIRDYQRIFFVFAFLFANQNMTFCKTNDQQMIFSNFWRWTLKKKLSPRFLIYIQKLLNIKSVNDMKEIKKGLKDYIKNYLSRDESEWNVCSPFTILSKVIKESNIKISGTEIYLMNSLSKNNIGEIKKLPLKKLPTGLSGLSGLFFISKLDKKNNLELTNILNKVISEIDKRITRFEGVYVMRLNSFSTIISPYIYDGISGFMLIALENKKLDNLYLKKFNFFNYISQPFSKVGGILNGLSGETLALITYDIKYDKKIFKSEVFEQLFTIIDQIYFRSSYPMMFNYQKRNLDNTYSNGVSGILDVIDLALSYY